MRTNFTQGGRTESAEAALALVAVGCVADTAQLNLAAVGVSLDARGNIKVDELSLQRRPDRFRPNGDVSLTTR